MPRYVAFLRAINVGGRVVKMEQLRRYFEELGFGGVSTFIASGNVIFDSPEDDPAALESRIEASLRAALGYEVATLLRSDAEVARIAAHEPFPDAGSGQAERRYVVFLRAAPDDRARDRVLALASEEDRLRLDGRELHWLRRGNLPDSTIGVNDIGRALGGMVTTVRNTNTVRRLAAKYPPTSE